MRDQLDLQVDDPAALQRAVDESGELFVPTTLHESLREHVNVVARFHGGRTVDVEGMVVARRPPNAASPHLPAGVKVRVVPGEGATRLRRLLDELNSGPTVLAEARFPDRDALDAAAEKLLGGGAVLLEVDRHVPPSAHAVVQLSAPGAYLLDLGLEVLGVGHVDDLWQIRAVLYDEDGQRELREHLAG